MTKIEYLRNLEKELVLLDEEIADDIIEYYKNRFEEESRYENKSDQKIIDSMGDPETLAKRIYSSYGIKPDLWESARDADIDSKKAIPLLLFDIFVASWVIPLLVFTTLAGLATFITFPLVVATLPNLALNDMVLVIMLSFGAYAILFLLVLGIAEMSIIVIRTILIMNIKILSPRNKTTSRMIKKVSLFEWMRRMKMGRNIFLNIGMVAISIVAISFVLLSTFNSDVLSSFGTPTMIPDNIERDLSSEIEAQEPYTINVNVGDVEINFARNLSNSLKISREYNMDDAFTYKVDTDNNIISINTIQDQVDDGLFTKYESSLLISLPKNLIIDKMEIIVGNGNVDMWNYNDIKDFSVSVEEGDVVLYKVSAVNSSISVDSGQIFLMSSNYDTLDLSLTTGFVFLATINNLLTDGTTLSITNQVGGLILEDVYFENVELTMPSGDIYYSNIDDFYTIQNLLVNSEEGEVKILVPYENSIEEQGQE